MKFFILSLLYQITTKTKTMKKVISNSLMILSIVHLLLCFSFLFHIGTEKMQTQTIDKLAAFSMLVACFYFVVSMKISNSIKINH